MISSLKKFLLLENIKQAKSILNKKGLDINNEKDYNDILSMFKKNPNLIGIFVKFRYDDNIPMENIKNVSNWILNNRQLLSQLPNNILTYKNFEKLEDDIEKLNREQLIKKFYNSLYRSMKDEIDKLEDKGELNELSYNFMKLPDELKKNFTPLKYFESNNISLKDFMNALSSYIENNTVNSDKESILKIVNENKDKIKIVYDKNNLLVIQSNNKDVIKKLGSQSWCIVYSNDYYQVQYFGYGKGNTQFIIFNFNLPSSSSNSMFGITIDENGKTMYGACQDKYNRGKNLEEVIEITGIPKDIFKPDVNILKEKEKLDKFKDILKNGTLMDIINYIKNNNIKNIDKKIINDLLSTHTRKLEIEEDLKRLLINNKDNLNGFLNKYDIFSILSDNIIMIYGKNIEDVFSNIDNMIIMLLHHIKNRDNRIFANTFESSITYNEYFFNVIKDIKLEDINKINNKYDILDDNEKIQLIYDLLIEFIKEYIYSFLNLNLFSYKHNIDWDTYLNFYNEYGLKLKDDLDNYDYYSLLTTFSTDKLFYYFVDDDNFTDFIIKLTKEHPNDFDISDIVKQGHSLNMYDLLSHDNISRIYEELNIIPNNTIEKIYLFNKTNMITYDEISNELELNKWEDEGYCIELSDFTELDKYFEYDYFNSESDNYHNYIDDIRNYDAIQSILSIDIKNIREISNILNDKGLLTNSIDNRILNINELEENDITKLKNDIIDIIDNNEDDLNDLILSLKRSMSHSYNISYENEIFKELINSIMTELPFKRFKDGKSYKFKDSNVCFLLDINLLLDINDYHDLYYNCNENFKWDDILDYYVYINVNKVKPNLDYIYGDWSDDIDSFNEDLNYQLSEI